MRDMESAFSLMRCPLESNESNLKFICMKRPTKSSLVVMGGGDPAAFHASEKSGESMIATPWKRC
jgi:hypothetical protein